jgi:probable O-glycosylation ligase (exosortase A-associated)
MLRTLFISTILIPGIVMAFRDRFMALLVYLWVGFFRPQEWVWIDISALRLSLVLAVVLIVPSFATGILPNLTHPLSIGTALFLLSTIVSQIDAVAPAVGWEWVDFQARLTVVCLVAITLMNSKKRILRVIAVIGASIGFHATKAGIASILGGGARFFDGLGGSFTDNNGYALGTVMIIPLLLATALNAELLFDDVPEKVVVWLRRGFYLTVPLCAFTVVSTFSRGGFLALAAAALTYIALHRQRVRLSLALVTVAVIALALVPIPEGYFDRLNTIRTYDVAGQEDDSALSREHFWRVAMVMADKAPLGVGVKQYEAAYDQYDFCDGCYGVHRSVHSSHFQVLAEQGYAGLAIWILQFAYAGWVLLRVRRAAQQPDVPADTAHFYLSTANCLAASMAGFFVGGAFVALSLNDVTWLTFAILAALDRLARQVVTVDVESPRVVAPAPALATAQISPAWQRPTQRSPKVPA